MSAAVTDAEMISLFARCVGFDPASATGGELDAQSALLGRVVSWAEAQRARIGAAKRALEDAASASFTGASKARPRRRARPMPGPGSGSGAQSRRDDAAAEGARRCPSFADALASGRVSADHLAAVGRVRNADDATRDAATLLAAAAIRSADEFATWLRGWDDSRDAARGEDVAARRRAKRRVSFGVDDEGMQITRAVLPPADHAAVSQALHDTAEALRRNGDVTSSLGQRMADALVGLVTGRLATSTPAPAPAPVPAEATAETDDVIPDDAPPADRAAPAEPSPTAAPAPAPAASRPTRPPAPTILAILHEAWMRSEADRVGIATTLDGVPLTLTELRIALCEAEVLPVVLGGKGEVVDYGRTKRHATDAQWRALLARDGGCGILGCPAPVSATVVHHCRPWEHGGNTDLSNLCLLCAHHHRQLHHQGWTATVERGVVRITTPAGIEIPTRNRNGPTHHERAA